MRVEAGRGCGAKAVAGAAWEGWAAKAARTASAAIVFLIVRSCGSSCGQFLLALLPLSPAFKRCCNEDEYKKEVCGTQDDEISGKRSGV